MAEKTLNIENAHIMFKNFSGKGDQFNRAGDRNFCVRIDDPDFARQLRNEGWNVVKTNRARKEGCHCDLVGRIHCAGNVAALLCGLVRKCQARELLHVRGFEGHLAQLAEVQFLGVKRRPLGEAKRKLYWLPHVRACHLCQHRTVFKLYH